MTKTKKYMTKKRKAKLAKQKAIALLLAIVIGSAVIGYAGEKEAYKLPQDAPIVKKVISAQVEVKQASAPVNLVKLITNKPEVETQIRELADKENFKWPDYLVKLANCESGLNPNAVNNQNNIPKESRDRGLFQFNTYWQKGVSDECAFSVECSTKTAMNMINQGLQIRWPICNAIVLARN